MEKFCYSGDAWCTGGREHDLEVNKSWMKQIQDVWNSEWKESYLIGSKAQSTKNCVRKQAMCHEAESRLSESRISTGSKQLK